LPCLPSIRISAYVVSSVLPATVSGDVLVTVPRIMLAEVVVVWEVAVVLLEPLEPQAANTNEAATHASFRLDDVLMKDLQSRPTTNGGLDRDTPEGTGA